MLVSFKEIAQFKQGNLSLGDSLCKTPGMWQELCMYSPMRTREELEAQHIFELLSGVNSETVCIQIVS